MLLFVASMISLSVWLDFMLLFVASMISLCLVGFYAVILQCLKWTVAQLLNANNILFGRSKAAPN
jgi:hypothetical protein